MKRMRTVVVLAVSIALVYVATGCATLREGPSDEEQLLELLTNYKTALEEGDVDKLVGLYSKNYASSRGGDYEETVSRLRQFVPRFKEFGVEVSTADTKIEVEGTTARLDPITFDSPRGSRNTALVVAKEADGVWRITGSERGQE